MNMDTLKVSGENKSARLIFRKLFPNFRHNSKQRWLQVKPLPPSMSSDSPESLENYLNGIQLPVEMQCKPSDDMPLPHVEPSQIDGSLASNPLMIRSAAAVQSEDRLAISIESSVLDNDVIVDQVRAPTPTVENAKHAMGESSSGVLEWSAPGSLKETPSHLELEPSVDPTRLPESAAAAVDFPESTAEPPVTKKKRAPKRVLSQVQCGKLSAFFAKKQKLSTAEKINIAIEVGVEVDQVDNWFAYQRRNLKLKNETSKSIPPLTITTRQSKLTKDKENRVELPKQSPEYCPQAAAVKPRRALSKMRVRK